MPKMKVLKAIEKKDYIYELLGVSLFLFGIISIARIGLLGLYINLILRIIFGEFSFIINLFLICLGIYGLLKKKFFNFYHVGYLGAILIYFSLSVLSCIAIDDALASYNGSFINKNIELYKNYFSVPDQSFIVGGGIIASIFYSILTLCFGRIGMILITLTILVTGICFLFQVNLFKKIIEGKFLFKLYEKTKKLISVYLKNLYGSKTRKNKRLFLFNLSLLENVKISETHLLQQSENKDIKRNLLFYLNQHHIDITFLNSYTSYTSSRFVVRFDETKKGVFKEEVNQFFHQECLLLKNGSEYFIDYYNQFKELFCLKRLLDDCYQEENIGLFSMIDNNYFLYDILKSKGLYIIGAKDSGINNYFCSFVVILLFKFQLKQRIKIFDPLNRYEEYFIDTEEVRYLTKEESFILELETLEKEFEKRTEIFKYLDVDNLNDANSEIDKNHNHIDKMLPIFNIYFIDDQIDTNVLAKINFLLRYGVMVGIYSIFFINSKEGLLKVNMTNSTILLFNTGDLLLSLKILGNDLACFLQKKGDVLCIDSNQIYHGQTPFISNTDFKNVLKKLI